MTAQEVERTQGHLTQIGAPLPGGTMMAVYRAFIA